MDDMASDLKLATVPVPGHSKPDRHCSLLETSPRKIRHVQRRHGSWSASDFQCRNFRNVRHHTGKAEGMRTIMVPHRDMSLRFPSDPLGLEGLLENEDLNRAANATPLTSPMVTPAHRQDQVEVVIPGNIADPLRLDEPGYSSDENSISGNSSEGGSAGGKRKRKHSSGRPKTNRGRKRRKTCSESEERKSLDGEVASTSASTSTASAPVPVTVEAPKTGVVQAPEVVKERSASPVKTPQPKPKPFSGKKQPLCRFGNYYQYYSRRNPEKMEDNRFRYFQKPWFESKVCLDIGCNIGHVTYTVARDFQAAKVIGVDIDNYLIAVARKNLRHYIKAPSDASGVKEEEFPKSMKPMFGGLKPRLPIPCDAGEYKEQKWPFNVGFYSENYVGKDDSIIESSEPEKYDTVLCLSTTKWIHLNWGDEGLMRLFKRVFKELKPGGRFILEPQSWTSYTRVKKAIPDFATTYNSLKLRPQQFSDILIGQVGFKKMEFIACPRHEKRGYSRPIQIYRKSEKQAKSRASVSFQISTEDGGKKDDDNAAACDSQEPASSELQDAEK